MSDYCAFVVFIFCRDISAITLCMITGGVHAASYMGGVGRHFGCDEQRRK